MANNVNLERRIRELSARAVMAQDADELELIVCELKDALHEHIERLKAMLAEYPFSPSSAKPAA